MKQSETKEHDIYIGYGELLRVHPLSESGVVAFKELGFKCLEAGITIDEIPLADRERLVHELESAGYTVTDDPKLIKNHNIITFMDKDGRIVEVNASAEVALAFTMGMANDCMNWLCISSQSDDKGLYNVFQHLKTDESVSIFRVW